jgi:hypothetical protein
MISCTLDLRDTEFHPDEVYSHTSRRDLEKRRAYVQRVILFRFRSAHACDVHAF